MCQNDVSKDIGTTLNISRKEWSDVWQAGPCLLSSKPDVKAKLDFHNVLYYLLALRSRRRLAVPTVCCILWAISREVVLLCRKIAHVWLESDSWRSWGNSRWSCIIKPQDCRLYEFEANSADTISKLPLQISRYNYREKARLRICYIHKVWSCQLHACINICLPYQTMSQHHASRATIHPAPKWFTGRHSWWN